jgi:hypothetical protein
MADIDQELSEDDGRPYFLYEVVGAPVPYYYSNQKGTLIWNSINWLEGGIKHTEIKQNTQLSKNSITVKMDLTLSFADLFVGWTPDYPISLTVRRGHLGAADTLVYWKGRVASSSFENDLLVLKCENIFTSLRRPGVRERSLKGCRHMLYQPGCNVDPEDFAVAGTLTNITGDVYTVTEASGYATNWFTGGYIKFGDDTKKFIRRHSGTALTLSRTSRYAEDNFTGSDAVTLYPGCDKTIATCKDKFDNLPNQGGFRWIPNVNVLGGISVL